MEMRFAREEEKDKIKEIWSYCFEDTESFVSWYFDHKYQASNTLAVYIDDLPVSSLQLLPYTLNFHGKETNVSYVVGVDTMPEARGKGYVKALLQQTLKVVRERGEMISILLPFQYSFYRKYGWETCYYHKFYQLELQDLKSLAVPYGKMRAVDFAKEKDLHDIMQLYEHFTADKHGYIVRSQSNWEAILTDLSFDNRKGYILEDDKGAAQGYIFYGIKEKVFDVFEMAYTSPKAYRGLLWFVFVHAAQVQRVVWKAPIDDMMFAFLDNPVHAATLHPFVMARVVDVACVLQWLVDRYAPQLELSIKINDTIADWNNRTFKIYKGKVTEEIDSRPELSCSINTFTQLAMGFVSPRQVERIGLLNAQNISVLEKADMLFKSHNNFINDYY